MRRGRKTAAIVFFLTLFLTGCVGQAGQKRADAEQAGEDKILKALSQETLSPEILEPEEKGDSAEKPEAESDDEISADIPAICVDRLGYITSGTKEAIFCGPELPAEFYVVRADSGERIFTGQIRNGGYDEERQEYNGYGDFSEVQMSGLCYIEAPALGRSYTFEIGDSLYEDALQRVMDECEQSWQDESEERPVVDTAREMAVLLLAWELNGDFLDHCAEDGSEIPGLLKMVRREAECLLQMQETETGAVDARAVSEGAQAEEGPLSHQNPSDPVSAEAYAMALARFSYLYQDYDAEFATECLKAADRAWTYGELNGIEESDGWRFAAAAELYRASGRENFRDCVHGYLSEENLQDQMSESVLQGCVTYLLTRQPVELALCEEITRTLMTRADRAAVDAHSSPFLARESEADGNSRKLLEDSMYLCLVNHMAGSREYELVVENCLHYLMGRNRQSASFLEAGEENEKLIFLLSEVLCWQGEHEEEPE